MESKIQNKQTPPVIVKSEFYDLKSPKRDWVSNNYIDNKNYSSKSSYKSMLHYSGRVTESEAIKKTRLLGYLEYQNQDFKVTSSGHFTRNSIFTNEQMEKEIKDNPHKYEVPKKSLVWSQVVSFSKEFFEENHIMKKEDAHKIISKTMDRFFLDNHIDPKSMTWIGQFHVDTPHHYHVHLRIHQNSPGHFNRETKRDEWREKGKWSKSSLLNLRKNIEEVAVAEKMTKERAFKLIGSRDAIKYEVLGTLKNSKEHSEFSKMAYELKMSLPSKGRLQVNSKRLDVVSKLRLDKLTDKLLSSNKLIRDKWSELNNSINDPINKHVKNKKTNSKHGIAMIGAYEKLRKNKRSEIRDHISNQIIKFVVKNDWRNNASKLTKVSSKANYSTFGFNKSKNKAFKKFSKKSFWDTLINDQDQDVQKALSAIDRDLTKFKREAASQQER